MNIFRKVGACLTAAALMETMAVTVSADTEAKKMVTASSDLSIKLGDGYFITNEGKFVYMDDEVLSNWRATGSLAYKEVKSDLSVDNIRLWSGDLSDGDYIQVYSSDTNGSPVERYVLKLDRENNSFKTVQTFGSGWCSTASDGYTFSYGQNVNNGTVDYYVVQPDGTTVQNSLKTFVFHPEDGGSAITVNASRFVGGKKYCGYITVFSSYETTETNFFKADYTVYSIDINGVAEKVCEGQKNSIYNMGIVYGDDDFVVMQTSTDGVHIDIDIYPTDGGSPKKLSLRSNGFGSVEYVDNSRLLFNIEFDGDTDAYLFDLNSGEAVAAYREMYTHDGEIFLVKSGKKWQSENADYEWGFIDRNGKELAMFDDASEFIGDYALVLKNGKAYLIDRNMNCVSEKIDATGVSNIDDGLYLVHNGDKKTLVTYSNETIIEKEETSKPSQTSKPAQTSKPDDSVKIRVITKSDDGLASGTDSSDSTVKTDDNSNPPTGAGGIALTVGVIAAAGAVVAFTRKRK